MAAFGTELCVVSSEILPKKREVKTLTVKAHGVAWQEGAVGKLRRKIREGWGTLI